MKYFWSCEKYVTFACSKKLKKLNRKYYMFNIKDCAYFRPISRPNKHKITLQIFVLLLEDLYDKCIDYDVYISLSGHINEKFTKKKPFYANRKKIYDNKIWDYCDGFDKNVSLPLDFYIKFKNKNDYYKWKLAQ